MTFGDRFSDSLVGYLKCALVVLPLVLCWRWYSDGRFPSVLACLLTAVEFALASVYYAFVEAVLCGTAGPVEDLERRVREVEKSKARDRAEAARGERPAALRPRREAYAELRYGRFYYLA